LLHNSQELQGLRVVLFGSTVVIIASLLVDCAQENTKLCTRQEWMCIPGVPSKPGGTCQTAAASSRSTGKHHSNYKLQVKLTKATAATGVGCLNLQRPDPCSSLILATHAMACDLIEAQ
jgi:hypothetical protein